MSDTLCKVLEKHVFWHGDLDLWPLTLTFIHNLDIINIHHHTKFETPKSNGLRDINFYLVIFGPMNYFLVTDRQMDRRKAIHKSPPCMSTGGLKNYRNHPWEIQNTHYEELPIPRGRKVHPEENSDHHKLTLNMIWPKILTVGKIRAKNTKTTKFRKILTN